MTVTLYTFRGVAILRKKDVAQRGTCLNTNEAISEFLNTFFILIYLYTYTVILL